MLVGVFINNFKVYKNLEFIPLINEQSQNISVFIGENGAGKSSVLEAIDVIFNTQKWVKNIHKRSRYSSISLVFIISKTVIHNGFIYNQVSDYFWRNKLNKLKSRNIRQDIKNNFSTFIDKIEIYYPRDQYHLVVIGIDHQNNIAYLDDKSTEAIKNSLRPYGVRFSQHEELWKDICNLYSYIYLPVHSSPISLLNIQNKEIQALMDRNITIELENLLSKQDRVNSKSIIEKVNESLSNFIANLNTNIQSTNTSYGFLSEDNYKLNEKDIIDIIYLKYFSKYPLKKDNKSIDTLSSGEQRIAVIDIAHTLISSNQSDKKLIIAVDEPEASLSSINCLNQFQKLFEISGKNQVIIATHWYGLLINSIKACLIHLSKSIDQSGNENVERKLFNLNRIHDERRSFPDDFQMKSYFDLASSLLLIIRSESRHWIICEGSDDKNYLTKILGQSSINTLAVGGCDNVIKLFEYISIAAKDKVEAKQILGKVLFIIDTDINTKSIATINSGTKKIVNILRFQIKSESHDINATLVQQDYGQHSQTEIEDCLCPIDFFAAVSATATKYEELGRILENFEVNTNAPYSGINQGLLFIKPKPSLLAHEADDYKDKLKTILNKDEVKAHISNNYMKTTPHEYSWKKSIYEFFGIPN